ncbi:uncharacterized protein [Onthophagus taurus]|uniref:uncharacterized protein n=1 Tax=Onthophagus taurus TaxID=166361 RepID=UPI000C20692C|nr:uncharacterized protein LOC111413820 [Onthophagus taurus]
MNNFDLIENIRLRRPLWDKTTWDKVDVIAREELWSEVASKMDTSKEIVKTRWKNLRDSYRKIMRKLENLETDDPKWSYFKAMEFMKDITLSVRARSHDISLKKADGTLEPDYSITLLSTSAEDSVDPLQMGFHHHLRPPFHIKQEAGTGRRRHATEDLVTHFLDLDADKHEHEKQLARLAVHEDDDYQFLVSLYPHLKQVPVNRKLMLRMKIEHLIYNEVYLQNTTVTTQTCNPFHA